LAALPPHLLRPLCLFSSLPFEPFFEAPAMRSRAVVLPLLAGLVLFCSATRAQVSVFFFFPFEILTTKKPFEPMSRCPKPHVVSSSALEEEGRVLALCSCLLCWDMSHSWRLPKF